MKQTPQPHPKPKTLDELIANAEHYARYCMGNSGCVTPALFFVGADGQGMFCPESLADGRDKDNFADMSRFVCIAHAVTIAVMVLESWAKFAAPGETFDAMEAPSEAIDRKEYVILTGESRDGNRQKFLPIIRSGNGRFFGFGEPYEPGAEMTGRFAGLIPSHTPDAQMRELAKAVLEVKGGRVQPGTLLRASRRR